MRLQSGKPISLRTSWLVRVALPVLFTVLGGVANVHAAAIQYEVSELGVPGSYRYTYIVSGRLEVNQEVDIRFDPTLFINLRNGFAGNDFDLLLFQPNNPPGTSGDFSALALVDNPALPPFRVDVSYLGVGLPGAQPFFINTYNQLGNLIGSEVGVTLPPGGGSGIPEPGTFSTAAIAAIAGGACYIVRRRRFADPTH